MSRLRLLGIGIPAAIGLLAGVIAQSYWVRDPAVLARRQLWDQGPTVRQGSRLLCVRIAVLPAGAQLHFRCGVSGVCGESGGALHLWRHPAVGTRRCAKPLGAYPVGQPGGRAGAAQSRCLLAGSVRAAVAHPRRQAVHRRRLHRHQRRAAGQADPDGDRADLRRRRVLRSHPAGLADSCHRPGAVAVVVVDRGCRLAVDRRADQRQARCRSQGKRVHQPKYPRDAASLWSDRRRGELPQLHRRRAGKRPAGRHRPRHHLQHPAARPHDHQPGVHPVPAGQELLLLPRPAVHRPLPRPQRRLCATTSSPPANSTRIG